MGILAYLILSILCAGLQHEILASSPGGASSSGSRPTAFIVTGPTPPEMEQGIRFMYMDNPTKVFLVSPDPHGLHTRITGHGLAVHPYFVAARIKDMQRGCKISSFQDNKWKTFEIEGIIPSPKDNVVLLRTKELILLNNGHMLQDGFIKYKYGQREYDWVKCTVRDWIAKNTLPVRHYRGDED